MPVIFAISPIVTRPRSRQSSRIRTDNSGRPLIKIRSRSIFFLGVTSAQPEHAGSMSAMAASLSFGRDRDLGLPERAPADQLLERMIELSLYAGEKLKSGQGS